VKFLYIKNKKLNEQLYNIQLQCATVWHIVQSTFDNKLQQEMEDYYNNLNKKLDNLQSKQKGKTKNQDNPYGL
jgi:nitrate reductase beta subunit